MPSDSAASPSLERILRGAPAPVPDAGRRAEIRGLRAEQGRRTVALDDDPTGSQSVHGVELVTVLEPGGYAAALTDAGATAFLLTNSRSLAAEDAAALTERVGAEVLRLGAAEGWPLDLVSRSDSTLRGHLLTEVAALDRARRAVHGAGFDGVLLVPAYLEAGRCTAGDVHWAMISGIPVPVGETEFARDRSFGYRSSDLVALLGELSAGRLSGDRVTSLSLQLIREGGVTAVAETLRQATGSGSASDGPRWFVVNATDYADLDTVALAQHRVQAEGVSLLARSGPSYVRSLSGIEPRAPLTAADLRGEGRTDRHGLLVVGSHVGLTGRQLARARERTELIEVELPVPDLLHSAAAAEARIAATAEAVRQGLAGGDVVLATSRELVAGDDPQQSLAIARTVSAALVEVVRRARSARPAWVVGKGGITSHDVAVHGLGIRRARVLGQLFDGMVSVVRALDAAPEVVGMPYVIFAGNVGDDDALAEVLHRLSPDSASIAATQGENR